MLNKKGRGINVKKKGGREIGKKKRGVECERKTRRNQGEYRNDEI